MPPDGIGPHDNLKARAVTTHATRRRFALANARGRRIGDMTLTPVSSTEAILIHHLQCFGARDLKGILTDYTPESVLCTPTGVLRGPKEITTLFQAMFAEFSKPGAILTMQQQTIEGDVAHIIWNAETADNIYELGTDTFVMRDGKIMAQTLAVKATPRH
jgi:ketosteroid isomerase-like protein